jgi:integrase
MTPEAQKKANGSAGTKGDSIFEGRRPGRPLSNMAMPKLLERMGRSDLTVHGFRSTFRDWAAERSNFPNEVVEMALAHVVENNGRGRVSPRGSFQQAAATYGCLGRVLRDWMPW